MKTIVWIFCLSLVLVACKDKPSEANEAEDIHVTCENKATFGDTTFCLPKLEGMTEGYKTTAIKNHANTLMDDQNTILAYYIPDIVAQKLKNNQDTVYDNYYKVYAPNITLNYSMTPFEMKEVMNSMANGMITINQSEVEQKLRDHSQMARNTPLLLERYSPTQETSTIISLMPNASGETYSANAVSISSLLLKDRLVFIAHYLNYKNESTITQLKKDNDTFIEKFSTINPNN